jgi:hypothetical protein
MELVWDLGHPVNGLQVMDIRDIMYPGNFQIIINEKTINWIKNQRRYIGKIPQIGGGGGGGGISRLINKNIAKFKKQLGGIVLSSVEKSLLINAMNKSRV